MFHATPKCRNVDHKCLQLNFDFEVTIPIIFTLKETPRICHEGSRSQRALFLARCQPGTTSQTVIASPGQVPNLHVATSLVDPRNHRSNGNGVRCWGRLRDLPGFALYTCTLQHYSRLLRYHWSPMVLAILFMPQALPSSTRASTWTSVRGPGYTIRAQLFASSGAAI